jgi:hypothetical protein
LKQRAVAFCDCYRHLRAVNEIDQEYRGVQLKILDDTIFNGMGQSKIHSHSHSPMPFAGKYPFRTASSSDMYSPRLVLPNYRKPGFQYFKLLVFTQTSSEFTGDAKGLVAANCRTDVFG